jgi:hypothetical protein
MCHVIAMTDLEADVPDTCAISQLWLGAKVKVAGNVFESLSMI